MRSLFRRMRSPSYSTAWVCLLTNQFATPGLGSIIAGRVWFGLVQLALALAGFFFVMAWFYHFFATILTGADLAEGLEPHAWQGRLGWQLFLASWLLAWVTSIELLWRARRREMSAPPRLSPSTQTGATGQSRDSTNSTNLK